jgi:hypothetical protein
MIKTLILIPLLALQFQSVDKAFMSGGDYRSCEKTLLEMLPQAENGTEKANVLWRLARVEYMLGEAQTDKMKRRELFNQGIAYAEQSIQENPREPQCYMWHCANVGRECQTHPLMEQAKAVPAMTKDLTKILNSLSPRLSEAWQALSEIHYHHPLKSNDTAINYARTAALNVPTGEPRVTTYLYLIELLYERNWSADKRASQVAEHSARLEKMKGSANIDRYALADGMQQTLPWSAKSLGALSDREEALALAEYALSRYRACQSPSVMDRKDFQSLQQWIQKHK